MADTPASAPPSTADLETLVAAAVQVRERAYAPYSNYKVGAALLTASGRLYTGCNVENASYGLCLCAERSAVARAVCEGERELVAVAVATSSSPPAPPCGLCRQTLAEFARDLPIVLVNDAGERIDTTLEAIFPQSFDGSFLKARQP